MKPEEYSQCRKIIIMLIGLIETLLFSGVLFGWADLVYLMKSEGVFSSRCHQEFPRKIAYTRNRTRICQEQDNLFDLAFTLVTFSKGSTSILVALLLDHFGLQISRLLANLQVTAGWYLIGYSAKSNPYLLYPGCLLLGLGGSQIRMNNFLIANLFPNHKSSIISLYNGAFCASAAIFLLVKYIYPFGFDIKTSCVSLAGLSGLMIIPTMFLFPTKTFETSVNDSPDLYDKSVGELVKSSSVNSDNINPCINSTESSVEISINCTKIKDYGSTSENKPPEAQSESQCQSFLTSDYLLHLLWSCVLGLAMAVYGGSFEHWVESITNDDIIVSNMVEWFGFCHIPMLLIAPLAGLWLDYGLNEAKKENDPDKRVKRARHAVFWCIFLTTVIQLLQLICMFFSTVLFVYTTLFIFIFSRPIVNAVTVVYLRISFPAEQFNCLFGVLGTMAAVFSLAQFPIFVWFGSNAFAANLLVVILISICFINPLHLLLKRT